MFIAVNEYDLHCIDVVRTCIYVCVIYQRIQDFLHVWFTSLEGHIYIHVGSINSAMLS